MYITGHVLQGLCTSMLLIAAAPPLFLGFPARNLRYTVVIIDLCIFGALQAILLAPVESSMYGTGSCRTVSNSRGSPLFL